MKQSPWARLVVAIGAGIALALSAPTLAAIGQFSPPVGQAPTPDMLNDRTTRRLPRVPAVGWGTAGFIGTY